MCQVKQEKSDFNPQSLASVCSHLGITHFYGIKLRIFAVPSSEPPDPDKTTIPTGLLFGSFGKRKRGRR